MRTVGFAVRTTIATAAALFCFGGGTALADKLVTNLDDAGSGSLRQAIIDANADALDDRIVFDGALKGTIGLVTSLPALTDSTEISGPGADRVTIDASATNDSVLESNITGTIEIEGLTLTGGNPGAGGGGIDMTGTGSLFVRESAIVGNISSAGNGGGIAASGSLDIEESLIAGNSAVGIGGVRATGNSIRIVDSTITGNTSTAVGPGGLSTTGFAIIGSSTIADNTGAGGSAANLSVAGLSGEAFVHSSIIGRAGDAAPNCAVSSGGEITSEGLNIDIGTSCGFDVPNDRPNTNPQLQALADNGGPTETMAIPAASPAVDKGSNIGVDQRGVTAPNDIPAIPNATFGNGGDIGAFERVTTVPSVTTVADDGEGSLRRAITHANVVPGADTINFAPGLSGRIELESPLPPLTESVSILGPQPSEFGSNVELESRDFDRVLTFEPAGAARTFLVARLDLSGTRTRGDGGVVLNRGGSLTVRDLTVTDGEARFGGGIYSTGANNQLNVISSTIQRNLSLGSISGGAIEAHGGVVIRNSTIADNDGAGTNSVGGVMSFGGNALVTIQNSTIADNTGTLASNLAAFSGGDITVASSIIGRAGDMNNCTTSAGTITSLGRNIDIANTCGFGAAGDQFNTDPGLGFLSSNNGGNTDTMAITASSPALDRGIALGGITTDQRGTTRPFDFPATPNGGGDGTDVGAFELAGGGVLTVTNTNDSGAGSFRQRLIDAGFGAGPNTITFAPSVAGTVQLQSPLPEIRQQLTITGPGADVLTVRRSSSGSYRIFTIEGVPVAISGLTLANGSVDGDGGGIRQLGGNLSLEEMAIVDNTATERGGGIFSSGFDTGLTVDRSTISGNTALGTAEPTGGGIDVVATTLFMSTSTITGNTAAGTLAAGGVMVRGESVLAEVEHSTIAGNTGGGASNIAFRDADPLDAVVLFSTILGMAGDPAPSCAGEFTSNGAGFNLDVGTSCGLTGGADQSSTNPLLGPLANNGGPTKTMALPGSSPAVDNGSSIALGTDQRGEPRPFNFSFLPNAAGSDGTDTGAFELQPVAPNDADGDGVADGVDQCPLGAAAGPDADGDGCKNAEDTDDDGDGDADNADNCPLVANADQANADGDAQGNACDTDDDGDGDADNADNCPLAANADQANADGDAQGDACDPDDDGDGDSDGADNCPLVANANQANADGDAQGDACDSDDDGDGVADASDQCPLEAGEAPSGCPPEPPDDDADDDGVPDASDACAALAGDAVNGCPDVKRTLKLKYDSDREKFKGKLGPAGECAAGQKVKIFEKVKGPDRKVTKAKTKGSGKFSKKAEDLDPGKYYAKVKPKTIATAGNCSAAKSKRVTIG